MHVSRKMWQNNIAFPFNLQDEFVHSYSTLIKNNYFSYSLDTGGIIFFFPSYMLHLFKLFWGFDMHL